MKYCSEIKGINTPCNNIDETQHNYAKKIPNEIT